MKLSDRTTISCSNNDVFDKKNLNDVCKILKHKKVPLNYYREFLTSI